jgi:hypothetical protein
MPSKVPAKPCKSFGERCGPTVDDCCLELRVPQSRPDVSMRWSYHFTCSAQMVMWPSRKLRAICTKPCTGRRE